MEPIKEAFSKVKDDIDCLKSEINLIRQDLSKSQVSFIDICKIISQLGDQLKEIKLMSITNKEMLNNIRASTDDQNNSTLRQISQTDQTDTSTHNHPLRAQEGSNKVISTGNGGVSTDRQTDRQTDRHINFVDKGSHNQQEREVRDSLEIIGTLDNLKDDLKKKFKKLTDQEMAVFSTIFQIEEEKGFADYRSLSLRLNITESSVRDYIGRLINKQIPLEKVKINNKQIHIIISPNLRKITTLSSILSLRSL